MKKTKLTRSLLAACSIVALSAVMYGCVHNGGDDAPATDMSGTPEPVPEPIEPAGPTDLEETQTAAAGAAAAAMTASDNAAASASSARDETMTLATLQTGDHSNSDAMGGREAAYAAHAAAGEAAAEAAKAATAAAEAAAAATGSEAEAALRMALDAQDAAEAAEATADTMAKAAIAAAATELHIVDTVKTVGESSVDADADASSSPPVPNTATVSTGFQDYLKREMVGAVAGKALVVTPAGVTTQKYVQAVQARDLIIGKELDTAYDKARLRVIHSRAGSKNVSVYAIDLVRTAFFIVTTNPATPTTDEEKTAELGVGGMDLTAVLPTFKSVGTYYQADQTDPTDDPTTTAPEENIGVDPMGLNHSDLVASTTKGKEVFSYVAGGDTPMTRYVVETNTDVTVGGATVVTYQHVDTTAEALPDDADRPDTPDDGFQQVAVKASLPMAMAYDHIHFGVWAALDEATLAGQKVAGLGIGFVQNFSDSGVTDRLGIGTVSYKGDWVAVIQRQNSAGKGAFNMGDGPATMTANFDKDEFDADLDGLAMLEGTLDGNGFSGMTATQISHDDLDSLGDFEGEFSGNIYGDKGEEAAGVFEFAGGEAGSFTGAFGGTNQ